MRKIIFQNLISLDGFFEGPNKEIDWHNVDDEFNKFANEFLDSVDLLLFGRITYELMASYWPTENAIKDDPMVANRMNSISKIVFSKTLDKAEWINTKLIKENVVDEILKLKQLPGKDIAVFGSSDLSLILLQHGLIDEIRVLINPVVIGNGKTIFTGINEKLKLKLLKTKSFESGNVMIYYNPIKL